MAAAAGVACAVCSGLANGSWNLPTKPDAPRSVYAGTVWAWENIWFVANVLIPVFNTIFVLSVVGVDVLREIFNEAEPKHLLAIVIPSLAWGWGGVGFGQAIKRLGVALGTSIVMGIIVGTSFLSRKILLALYCARRVQVWRILERSCEGLLIIPIRSTQYVPRHPPDCLPIQKTDLYFQNPSDWNRASSGVRCE